MIMISINTLKSSKKLSKYIDIIYINYEHEILITISNLIGILI